MQPTIPWINLEAYDITLVAAQLPQTDILPEWILMIEGDADPQAGPLEHLGFERRGPAGRWVHLGENKPTLAEIGQAFPFATSEAFDMDRHGKVLRVQETARGLSPEPAPDASGPRLG